MADYKRLVSYIYNYESGIRKRNIGFSRVESKNGQCKVTIHITASVSAVEPLKVYLFHRDGSEIEGVLLGNMTIRNGTGDFRAETNTQSLMNTDYGLDDISGVLIILNQNRFFGSQWDDQEIKIANFREYADKKEKERLDRLVRDIQLEPQNVTDMIMQEALAKQVNDAEPKEGIEAAELDGKEEQKNSASDAMKTMVNVVQSFFQEEPKKTNSEVPKEQDVVEVKITEDEHQSEEVESTEYKEESDYVESATVESYQDIDNANTSLYVEPESKSEEETVMQELVDAVEEEEQNVHDTEEVQMASAPRIDEVEEETKEYLEEQKEGAVTNLQPEKEEKEKVMASSVESKCCCSDNYPDCVRQLLKSFPPVKPFPDSNSENWVRIEPKDIGYLPVESWVLANNSFLLHGYYNYRHLLFGILEVNGGKQYVIGVPGVLQSTEQTMAGMFGFHRFLSAHEGENQYGSFGYWIQQIVL